MPNDDIDYIATWEELSTLRNASLVDICSSFIGADEETESRKLLAGSQSQSWFTTLKNKFSQGKDLSDKIENDNAKMGDIYEYVPNFVYGNVSSFVKYANDLTINTATNGWSKNNPLINEFSLFFMNYKNGIISMDNIYDLMKSLRDILDGSEDSKDHNTESQKPPSTVSQVLVVLSVVIVFAALIITSIVFRYKYTKALDTAQSETTVSFDQLI